MGLRRAKPEDALGWVLIESGSNQEFIFQSTRRRFQVGASAVLTDLPRWVAEALNGVGDAITPVVTTSSKALLLTADLEQGRRLVEAVTRRALKDAPGLDVWGYVEKPTAGEPMARLGDVHAKHAQVRWSRATPKQRFPLHPFLEACSLTSLPAVSLDPEPGSDGRHRPVSAPAAAILARANSETVRLSEFYGNAVLKRLDQDVLNAGWVAVVHADGNGVGQLITEIRDTGELTSFSEALEEATGAAFQDAVGSVDREQWMIPLILGGDDVTFICDGRVALDVTRAFLAAFEHRTGERPEISTLSQAVLGREYLTAAAGIAFVKPHFPFHAAYSLAEELAREAKQAKRDSHAPDRSSYDFHVLHDSIARPLAGLRDHLVKPAAGPVLWPGPFLMGERGAAARGSWEAIHEESFLLAGVAVLQLGRDEQVLSGTGAHDLRAALLAGPEAAERTATRLAARNRRPVELRAFLATQKEKITGLNRLIAALDAADVAAGVAAGERGGAGERAGQ